jgi:hypothetical protein
MLGMSLVFTLMIASARVLGRIKIESLDPFFSNADDFIGQPVSAIEGYGFSCSYVHGFYDSRDLRCVLEPVSGTFSEIVVVPSGDIVHQIVFIMRKDAVQSGHLIWLWGNPEVQSYGHSVYLYWRTRGILAVASPETRLMSPSLRVHRVYFLGESMPVVPDNQLTHTAGEVTIRPEMTLIQISSRPGDVQRASGLLRRRYMARDEMDWGVAAVNSQ